jgi:hypothetical protein
MVVSSNEGFESFSMVEMRFCTYKLPRVEHRPLVHLCWCYAWQVEKWVGRALEVGRGWCDPWSLARSCFKICPTMDTD